MQIQVRLYGALRDRLPREQRGRATLPVDGSQSIGEIVAQLGIDHPVMFAVNDQHELDESYRLHDGDLLALFEFTAGG